jgi:putative PEP-CTERM system histidine kinase
MVPLRHHSLIGFVVLARPRAPRTLGWEDFDLLKTVGRETANYLAEQRASQALELAREFEIFNRRFAFVVHDIKNLVSQLSLLGRNIEKFGDNKDFRDDMVATVKDATAKMQSLMDRIHAAERSQPTAETTRLAPVIGDLVAARADVDGRLDFMCEAPDLAVFADRGRLQAVMGHLIQNAIDAVGDEGQVKISLKKNGRSAVIEVTDNGRGMDSEFIRMELFKPFRSTKDKGMGIGAYQCREFARELGGELDAISRPGTGTTMRMSLPIVETD